MLAKKLNELLGSMKRGVLALIPVLLLLIYTFVGALIFYYVEGPEERTQLESLKKERDDLLENTAYRLNGMQKMKPLDAYNHTVATLKSYNKKMGMKEVDVEEDVKWTWWGAVFYALTVYTTIGYGNIYPVTTAGRILTIVYAFIGIPLALICLIALGGLFARICKFLWTIILKSLKKSTRVVSKDLEKQVDKLSAATNSTSKDQSLDNDLLSFPISFLIGLTIIWILTCAALFLLIEEEWCYGTSLYFTLISFTTIGFGDVIPSRPRYMMFICFCILIGLALVSTVLTIIQQQIEALASELDSDIDKEYAKAIQAAYEEGVISEDEAKLGLDQHPHMLNVDQNELTKSLIDRAPQPKLSDMQLDAIIARMPLRTRLLYWAMSERSRKRIKDKWEARQRVRMASTQTDAYLIQSLVENKLSTYQRTQSISLSVTSTADYVSQLCDMIMTSIRESEL